MPGMHVYFDDALKKKLEKYTENRQNGKKKTSQSVIIRQALERLFAVESMNPEVDERLRDAVSQHFEIPSGYELRSFFLTLWMLSKAYPQASSKKFWGELVFVSPENMSHGEVFEKISKEIKRGAAQHSKRN